MSAPHHTRSTTWPSPARLALAAAGIAAAAAIVFALKIGPVVLTLTATHGVHAGDALAALPTTLAILAVSPRPRRGT